MFIHSFPIIIPTEAIGVRHYCYDNDVIVWLISLPYKYYGNN